MGKKEKRGGKREGAGAPITRKPYKAITINIDLELLEWVNEKSKKEGKAKIKIIEEAILNYKLSFS